MSIMFIIKLALLFLIIYAIIKNLKTLLKAGIVILVILILLRFIGLY